MRWRFARKWRLGVAVVLAGCRCEPGSAVTGSSAPGASTAVVASAVPAEPPVPAPSAELQAPASPNRGEHKEEGLAASAPVVCRVDFSGSETLSIEGRWHAGRLGGKPPQTLATSDYWMSAADLRRALELMHGMFDYEGEQTRTRRVEEDMHRNPVFTPLSLACHDQREVGLDITGLDSLSYEQVPFKPGRYVIHDSFAQDRPQGAFTASIATPGDLFYRSAGGTLTVTRFDAGGVQGTFSLEAKPTEADRDEVLHIRGSFDFPCNGMGESLCRQ